MTTPFNLRSLATTAGFRTSWDPCKRGGGFSKEELPWLMRIESDHGFIALWTENSLAAVAIGKQRAKALARHAGINTSRNWKGQSLRPGWTLLQCSEYDARFGIPIDDVDIVAKLLGIRKRKPATAEQKAKLAAMTAARRPAKAESAL
jgi:hypothetical protein